MPALSGPGQFDTGTKFYELGSEGRKIGLRIWYPASVARSARRIAYRHSLSVPGKAPVQIVEQGVSVIAAAPMADAKFPLVVISHGYGGWAEQLSRLGETLASRGYVVASIDHRDPPAHDMPSFAASFGSVLMNRAADQQLVLRTLLDGKMLDPAIAAELDTSKVGLIGYSMGGYGAIITAGVPVDPAAPAFALLPRAGGTALPAPDPALASRLMAVVALAPWGGQPGAAVWRETDLAGLHVPILFVDGDQDDVVDFKAGVYPLFARTRGSDRYLLVYREASHNIAGNPASLPANADFSAIESLAEPVWRKDRIEAINQHFILAFLDFRLKGEVGKTSYLNVPTTVADDGLWPSAFGQQWGGKTAGDNQPGYWRGFQRRWARGLEMHHKGPGE